MKPLASEALTIKHLKIKRASFDVEVENVQYSRGLHVLLGANGSGKSSILTGLTGYDSHSIKDRELYFKGQKLDSTEEIISYLPQHNPSFQISVHEFINLTTNRQHYKIDIDEYLKHYKLEQDKDRSVDTLSGGEFKRALAAQIEMEDKPVIMMDEIEQGLDVNYQHLILSRLKKLSNTKIVILAMHDLSLAMTYADTVTTIKKGTVVNAKVPNNDVTSEMLSNIFSREISLVRQDERVAIFT